MNRIGSKVLKTLATQGGTIFISRQTIARSGNGCVVEYLMQIMVCHFEIYNRFLRDLQQKMRFHMSVRTDCDLAPIHPYIKAGWEGTIKVESLFDILTKYMHR